MTNLLQLNIVKEHELIKSSIVGENNIGASKNAKIIFESLSKFKFFSIAPHKSCRTSNFAKAFTLLTYFFLFVLVSWLLFYIASHIIFVIPTFATAIVFAFSRVGVIKKIGKEL